MPSLWFNEMSEVQPDAFQASWNVLIIPLLTSRHLQQLRRFAAGRLQFQRPARSQSAAPYCALVFNATSTDGV
jgi:hypothetical protein